MWSNSWALGCRHTSRLPAQVVARYPPPCKPESYQGIWCQTTTQSNRGLIFHRAWKYIGLIFNVLHQWVIVNKLIWFTDHIPTTRLVRLRLLWIWKISYSSSNILQLSAEVEVNSGGYLPSRFCEVNIHCYSPTLRWIIVLVYATQV